MNKLFLMCCILLILIIVLSIKSREKFSDVDLLNTLKQNTQLQNATSVFIQNGFKTPSGSRLFASLEDQPPPTLNQMQYALKSSFASDDKFDLFDESVKVVIRAIKTVLASYINTFTASPTIDPTTGKVIPKTAQDITLLDVIQGLNSPIPTADHPISEFGGHGFNQFLIDQGFFDNNIYAAVAYYFNTVMHQDPPPQGSVTSIDILKMVNFQLAIASGLGIDMTNVLTDMKHMVFDKWYNYDIFTYVGYPSPICNSTNNCSVVGEGGVAPKTIIAKMVEAGTITQDQADQSDALANETLKPALLVQLIYNMPFDPTVNVDASSWAPFMKNYLVQNNSDPALSKYVSGFFNTMLLNFQDIAVGLEHALKNTDVFYLDLSTATIVANYFNKDPYNLNIRPEDVTPDQLVTIINDLTKDKNLQWILDNICQPTLEIINKKLSIELVLEKVTADDVALAIYAYSVESDPNSKQTGIILLNAVSNDEVPKALQAVIIAAITKMQVSGGFLQNWIDAHPEANPQDISNFFPDVEAKTPNYLELSGVDKYLVYTGKKIALDILYEGSFSGTTLEILAKGWKLWENKSSIIFKAAFKAFNEVSGKVIESMLTWMDENVAKNFLTNGIKSTVEDLLSTDVAEEVAITFISSLSVLGVVQIVGQVILLLVNLIGRYCPCDHPKREVHFDIPICYKGTCEQEFGEDMGDSTLGLCAKKCGKIYGPCYYNNGTWCANNILKSGCFTQPWSQGGNNLKSRSTTIVQASKPDCKWADQSQACKLGYIDTCSDISQQPIIIVFDVLQASLAFD